MTVKTNITSRRRSITLPDGKVIELKPGQSVRDSLKGNKMRDLKISRNRLETIRRLDKEKKKRELKNKVDKYE